MAIITKAVMELSLMFVMARAVLGWLAGPLCNANAVWQVLDIAARPVLWITRRAFPKLVEDRRLAGAAILWMLAVWLCAAATKITACLQAGAHACT